MFGADDAEMVRGDRLAMLSHRGQQLGDATAVHLVDAVELSQRLVRTADFLEHFALNGGPGKSPELGDKRAHCAMAPEVAVSGNVGAEIALQPRPVVPVRAGRVARPPF